LRRRVPEPKTPEDGLKGEGTTQDAIHTVRAAQSGDGWMKRALHNRWLLRFAGLLVILALWEYMFSGGRINPIFSAPPSAVVKTVPDVIGDELYFPAVISTLRLFFLGFVIASVLGILLGLLLARVRLLDVGLSPYLNALYASPLPAIIPILTAVLGYTFQTKLLIVVLLAIFPILINVHQGARSVDETLLEVAQSLRVSEGRLWRDVIIPSSLPFLIVGLRLGAARGMIGTAVAELYTSPDGLGYLILRYGFRFDMDAMLVVVLTFTGISLLLSWSTGLLERRVRQWKVSPG
jgi:ABC-type nitrate/sulfonate/bicarbonate transport system permease component